MSDRDQLRAAEVRAADKFWSAPAKFRMGDQDALDFLRFCIEEHRITVERRVRAEDEFTAGYPAGGLDPTPPPAGAAS